MIAKPFQGFRTFCKVTDDATMKYAIIGLPTDTATTFRPGTRFGPSAIRDASMMLTDGMHPVFEANLVEYVTDLGDVDLPINNTTKMLDHVSIVTDNVLNKGMHPVFLGGDHTVTLGILRTMNKWYNKVAVIHFDAHCDTWSTNFDEPVGHGTWLYNAIEEGLVDPTKVISIGIRSAVDPVTRDYLESHGGTTYSARAAMADINDLVSTIREKVGNTPVYLSFDIDALDPAYAPGTGTPEIGGLTSMWAIDCMEYLRTLNWIGMDVVEVSPPFDHAFITALAAATLAWTYLSMNIYNSNEPTICEDVLTNN